MTEVVTVEFKVTNREQFLKELQLWDQGDYSQLTINCVEGYRADDYVNKREALVKFVNKMEEKLRKNDHKSNWREKPIEALLKLLKLELKEFEVAYEFFDVAEARPELVDIANFAMIVWDRLGMLDQEQNALSQIQYKKEYPFTIEMKGDVAE